MQDDSIGQTFNRLKVIKFVTYKYGQRFFECQCTCGKVKLVNIFYVKKGITKSCGCLGKDNHWKRKLVEFNGRKDHLNVLCKENGVQVAKMFEQLKSGLTFEQALSIIKPTI